MVMIGDLLALLLAALQADGRIAVAEMSSDGDEINVQTVDGTAWFVAVEQG